MSATASRIASIIAEPRDISGREPSNKSLRGLAKQILRDLLREIENRRRLSKGGFPELSSAEERAARFVIATYNAATDEHVAEHPVPPISLGDLTADTLRQLLSTEEPA